MEIFKTNDVFTPSSPANYTFVEREISLNEEFVDALITRGKQLIIYGETGTGKTTLLLNKLNQTYENYVITRCMRGYTFEKLILDAFDQLNKFYTTTLINEKGWKINPEILTDYFNLKAEINDKHSSNQQRILPLQLTINRLAKFIGEIKACWVIEDFHKIDNVEKMQLSQAMKIFMDTSFDYPEVKMIVTGAVDSPRLILTYDKELDNNRLSQILLPLMSENELSNIIFKGEDLLNIKFQENIIPVLTAFANGLPSFVHQLCLNMCLNSGVLTTQEENIRLENIDLEKALKQYMNTHKDTFQQRLHKAIGKANSKNINYRYLILKKLAAVPFKQYSPSEILIKINNTLKQKDNIYGKINYYLKDLTLNKRDQILRKNCELGTYSFNNPLMKAYTDYELNNRSFKDYDNLFEDVYLYLGFENDSTLDKN